MSLLHRALKKAERDEGTVTRGAHVSSEKTQGPPSLRLYLLIGFVITALLVTVFYQLSRKPSSVAPAPKELIPAAGLPAGVSAAQYAQGGWQKLEAGKFEEAKHLFEKAVLMEPRSAEAYNNLGLALKKLGRTQEAFEQYRKALSLDPQCAECLNNIGVLYLIDRDLTEAESHFQKTLSLRPDYAEPYFHLALLLEARGDLGGAKKNYLKFVELAKGVGADFLLKVQNRIASLQAP